MDVDLLRRSAAWAAAHLEAPSFVGRSGPRRRAAVLVAFYPGAGPGGRGAGLVFVKRPLSAPTHPGEIAFPGGISHPEDVDLAATALREAEEETGLDPSEVQLLGPMSPTGTVVNRTVITPYLGWVGAVDHLTPDEREIEAVLRVPVADLLHPDSYRGEMWGGGSYGRLVHFFEIEGETIWGATARILFRTMEALLAVT